MTGEQINYRLAHTVTPDMIHRSYNKDTDTNSTSESKFANFAWLHVYVCYKKQVSMSASIIQLLSQLNIWMSGCVLGENTALVKQIHPHFSHSPGVWQVCSSVPCRAFRRHIGEHFLRLGVWDGNDVFVVWSYAFLWVRLLSEFSGARALVVGVRGEGKGGWGWGAKCWVGNRKGWGESRFGAGNCRVVTLQEVVVDLAVSLLSRDSSLIIWAMKILKWLP